MDAENFLRRFPAQGIRTTALNTGTVLVSNAIVLWLLVDNSLRPAHLIALVMAETLLLMAICELQRLRVPAADWPEPERPFRNRIGLLIGMLIWIGGAYTATLFIVDGFGDFFGLLVSIQPWLEFKLYQPLFFTLGVALVHNYADFRFYRSRGGPFVSGVTLDAMSRYLTLVSGAIPFAMTCFVTITGAIKGFKFIFERISQTSLSRALFSLSFVVVVYGSLGACLKLAGSGVRGWAISFVFAKLLSELLIVCAPLLMTRIAMSQKVEQSPTVTR